MFFRSVSYVFFRCVLISICCVVSAAHASTQTERFVFNELNLSHDSHSNYLVVDEVAVGQATVGSAEVKAAEVKSIDQDQWGQTKPVQVLRTV